MAHQRLLLLTTFGLLVGLTGCQNFTRLSQWENGRIAHSPTLRVTAIPADAPQPGPDAAENELYQRAADAIDKRDYGRALDMLQLAREARESDPRVLTAMGVVYDKLGRFDLSSRYYALAEKADPGSKVVAADRAYSVVLQQRTVVERTTGAVVMVSASSIPRAAVIAGNEAVAPPTPKPAMPSLTHSAVRIDNATGELDGVNVIRTKLVAKGWSINRTVRNASDVSPITRLRFPPGAERVANGLAHTLPFRVNLEACPNCAAVELSVGANALGDLRAGRRAQVRRA